jgi:hypothetical protein
LFTVPGQRANGEQAQGSLYQGAIDLFAAQYFMSLLNTLKSLKERTSPAVARSSHLCDYLDRRGGEGFHVKNHVF